MDCSALVGAEFQRTQVAPEADVCTFTQIAGHEDVGIEGRRLFRPPRRATCWQGSAK